MVRLRHLALAAVVSACGDPPSSQYPTAPAVVADVEAPLGPGDVLDLHIYYGDNEIKASYNLGQSGTISVQFIGKVQAAGKRASELEDEIRTRLADGYLRDPIVSVT